jgi:glycosyltransferase involved in cell wall biosynthesis
VQFVPEMEAFAVSTANLTVTLSMADRDLVDRMWVRGDAKVPFLPPGIRADVAALPWPSDVCNTELPRPADACTAEQQAARSQPACCSSQQRTHKPQAGSGGQTSQQSHASTPQANGASNPASAAPTPANGASTFGSGAPSPASSMAEALGTRSASPAVHACSGQWPAAERSLLLCCVRMSPEKQPGQFVAVAAELTCTGVLSRLGVVPTLLAASATPFAESVVHEFQQRVPGGRVLRQFLDARHLSAVYAATRLNFHPCMYDAYGMTVIEAASQGAPSVMHAVRTPVPQCMLRVTLPGPLRCFCLHQASHMHPFCCRCSVCCAAGTARALSVQAPHDSPQKGFGASLLGLVDSWSAPQA